MLTVASEEVENFTYSQEIKTSDQLVTSPHL